MPHRVWSPTDRLEPTAADLIRHELRRLDVQIMNMKALRDRHGDNLAGRLIGEREARRHEVLDLLAAAVGSISG